MLNVSIENINRLIEKLRAEAEHFKMSRWVTVQNRPGHTSDLNAPLSCGTAACIGSWAGYLAMQDAKQGLALSDVGTYGFFKSKPHSTEGNHEIESLFHMDFDYSMTAFDEYPDDVRVKVAIRALEIFRDTGCSDWRQALRDIDPQMEKDIRTY